jgi:hypothetical protein
VLGIWLAKVLLELALGEDILVEVPVDFFKFNVETSE